MLQFCTSTLHRGRFLARIPFCQSAKATVGTVAACDTDARHGISAVELLDGESEPEVDLWQIGHNEDKTQKEAELIREVQRSRQTTKREQICETIRKTAKREMGMER